MSTRKQVSCVNKKPDHFNPHERIEKLGGYHEGAPWKLLQRNAVFNINLDLEEYYVSVNGVSVNLVVGTHNGQEYLKTEADDYAPNNLLNLPECPVY